MVCEEQEATAAVFRCGRWAGVEAPFKAVRPAWKKHSRTAGGAKRYGSKRSRLADYATPEDAAESRPARRVRRPEVSTGDDRSGVEEWRAHLRQYARPGTSASSTTSSSPSLSSESIHRTTAVLRAYTNILDSTVESSSPPSSACCPSTLAGSSAREVGWSIEENVRDWLVENGMVSPEPSSDADSSGLEDPNSERTGPTSIIMDRAEGASAQEAEMRASRLVDEWYEACPTYTWRWILAEHATSILVSELQDAEASYGVWETVLGVCVERGANSEASRLHRPLVQSAFALPPTATASTANILDILRLTPSPRALLHSALLPTLLSSAFEDRFFFHSFLTVLPSKLEHSGDTAIEVLSVLGEVAAKMVSTLQELRDDEDDDDEENEGLEEMVDEVLARMIKQVKAALPLLLEFPADLHRSHRQTVLEQEERTRRLELLSELVHDVLKAVGVSQVDENGATGELIAVALVIDLEIVTLRFMHDPEYRFAPGLHRVDQLLALAPLTTEITRSSSSTSPATSDSSDDDSPSHLLNALVTYYLYPNSRSTKQMTPKTSRTVDEILLVVQEVLCVDDSTDSRQRRRDDFARCLLLATRRNRRIDNGDWAGIEDWLTKLDKRRVPVKAQSRRPVKLAASDEEEARQSTYYEEAPESTRRPERSRKRTPRQASPRQHNRASRPSSSKFDESTGADPDVEVIEPAFSLVRPIRRSATAESTASTASSSSYRRRTREGSKASLSKRQRVATINPVEIVVHEPSPSPDLPSPPAPLSRSSTSSTASLAKRLHLKPPRSRSPAVDTTPTSSEPDDLDLLRSARRRAPKRAPPLRDDHSSPPLAPKSRSTDAAPPRPSPLPPSERKIGRRRRLEGQDRAGPSQLALSSHMAPPRGRDTAEDVGFKRRKILVEESSEDELAL
ncbi:proteophosphoglycan ppg4 [Rhodotorula toruloides]|uniref:Proteophosphoglycan ppg4 n=1 Tax=Rhodotorula toruloides TaxID=5286 RepID=A0A511KSX5_RHOTO|nr:proteophosphoglycan ppg4 [Rhodotorula toruloides]